MRYIRIAKYIYAVTFIFLLSTTFLSAKKYVLKFNHEFGSEELFHAGFLEWAENVERRTNGDVKIEITPNGQLGLEKVIIEQIRLGADLGQNTDAAHLSIYVPEMAVMSANYFVDSIDEVKKLKTLSIVKDWLEKLDKEYNIKVLSFFWIQGFKHFVTNKPIRTPLDLKGLRIRTSDIQTEHIPIITYGANYVDLSFEEIFLANQQKVIDGCELAYDNIYMIKLYEGFKYVNETRHALLINFVIISPKFFNNLPVKYQKILEEECDNAGLKTSNFIMGKHENDIKKQLKEKGMTIMEDVDRESFKKAGEQIYRILRLDEVRDQIYNQLGKNKK